LGLLEVLVDARAMRRLRARTASPVASPWARAPPIVALAWAGKAQLGDRDAVQGGIQLAVATA
jgi:hypothetical protein